MAAGQVPAALADLARRAVDADDAALPGLAAGFAADTDWRSFPVPVPADAVDRLLAEDGRAALVTVSFARQAGHDPDVDWLRSAIDGALRGVGAGPEVDAHVTGELALIKDTYKKAEDDNALMETVAYAIIFVVLLLFFRAVVPAVLTVAAIGLAMTVSQAALFALGHGVTLTQFTITIMNFVMLGAGVDYSMLLSSRYRQERLAGRSPEEAAVHATAHAGESMLLAAIAVVLAFGATLLSPVDWIPPLGYGGLIGIPIVLLAALTLTPALLVLLGDRFFALGRRPLSDLEHESALGRHLARAADLARRRKVAIVLVFAVITVPFAVITAQHRSTADPVALSPATDSKAGFELVAEKWGDATVLPTLVVARPAAGVVDPAAHRLTDTGRTAVTALTDRLAAVPGVARVSAVTRPFGTALPADQIDALTADVRRDYLADDGALRIVVELADPPYSEAAVATVDRIQDVTEGAKDVGALQVGGATQVDRQYGNALNSSFWQMIGLVSVGVFVMLVIALRSLLIPIRLILTIMMSNVWAIGITVLIFHFWLDRAIIDDLPIFLTVLMMGLGMDYEIFLVTRVRDLVRGGADQESATIGAVVDTGRVINAAGLVMAGSLGTMALSSTVMLQEYGAGLGLAVLLDATLIRMLFVPATLLLFRRYNWWLPSLRRTPRRRRWAPDDREPSGGGVRVPRARHHRTGSHRPPPARPPPRGAARLGRPAVLGPGRGPDRRGVRDPADGPLGGPERAGPGRTGPPGPRRRRAAPLPVRAHGGRDGPGGARLRRHRLRHPGRLRPGRGQLDVADPGAVPAAGAGRPGGGGPGHGALHGRPGAAGRGGLLPGRAVPRGGARPGPGGGDRRHLGRLGPGPPRRLRPQPVRHPGDLRGPAVRLHHGPRPRHLPCLDGLGPGQRRRPGHRQPPAPRLGPLGPLGPVVELRTVPSGPSTVRQAFPCESRSPARSSSTT